MRSKSMALYKLFCPSALPITQCTGVIYMAWNERRLVTRSACRGQQLFTHFGSEEQISPLLFISWFYIVSLLTDVYCAIDELKKFVENWQWPSTAATERLGRCCRHWAETELFRSFYDHSMVEQVTTFLSLEVEKAESKLSLAQGLPRRHQKRRPFLP